MSWDSQVETGQVGRSHVRTGQVGTGQVRTGQDKLDRACQTRTGHVQLGQGCVILEHVKLSQTGQVKLNRSSKKNIGMTFFEHKIFFDPKYLDPIFFTHIFLDTKQIFWIICVRKILCQKKILTQPIQLDLTCLT